MMCWKLKHGSLERATKAYRGCWRTVAGTIVAQRAYNHHRQYFHFCRCVYKFSKDPPKEKIVGFLLGMYF